MILISFLAAWNGLNGQYHFLRCGTEQDHSNVSIGVLSSVGRGGSWAVLGVSHLVVCKMGDEDD